jgi:site-specific DNA-methyltransferase (adenine-specific)
LLADPDLNAAFIAGCRAKGAEGTPCDWNRLLLRLRKSHGLPAREILHKTRLSARDMDPYIFASEIALVQIALEHGAGELTVDDMLCDPELAARFDAAAARHAPGFAPLAYRWAGLALRKRAHAVREHAAGFSRRFREIDLPRARTWPLRGADLQGQPGVYLLRSGSRSDLYLGETTDLGRRLSVHFGPGRPWGENPPLTVKWMPLDGSAARTRRRCALQSLLISRYEPLWNCRQLALV